ncbi:7-cyano-7-deazaguanine synthase [Streptomyces sp. 6N223]|uniref:7-cyano-7-deazaguanine synthase n=1 Tax=Streptomyces sp. 6N223 TaxID=3457412 RepID=UPI003FD574A2
MNHLNRSLIWHPVWWSSDPTDLPTGRTARTAWTILSENAYREREHRVTGRFQLPGPVPQWAEDFFRVARAVFLADKDVKRSTAPDGWTRHINLSVPVADPDRWRAPAALRHLTGVLETLTADRWDLVFRPLRRRPVQEAMPLADPTDFASEVALFSGGLDSLGWAATRARAGDRRPLLLVTFREIKLRDVQRQAFAAVRRLTTRRHVTHLLLSLTPAGKDAPRELEQSSRSRGLLYASCAIRAAAAHRVGTVHLPENGQLALNPPLTAARLASCSTRSVHPWTLHHLNTLMDEISGGEAVVRVDNPLAHLTKGEVCRTARTAGLSQADLESTLSCGRPPKRWARKGPRPNNCGYCFPCLVRRSGLVHANGHDHTPYLADPRSEGEPEHRTEDWRALRRWLHSSFTLPDLLADFPLPLGSDLAVALDVIARGRRELRNLEMLTQEPS